MKRPTGKVQATTCAGAASMFGGVLMIFSSVKLEDVFSVAENLTCGEIFAALMPLAGGIWAMIHNEGN